MTRQSLALSTALAAGLALLGGVHRAQANDPVAAQALYEDGKRLMGEKKFAEACPKFAESQRLDPGVGTHYALADCYESAGRIATAWAAFIDVESESNAQNRADRAAIAKKRAAALAPRLARIAVAVPDSVRVAGLVVKRDTEELGEGQWGTAVPVDPGRHEVIATAPGKKEWRTSVDVSVEGKVFPVAVPALEDAPVTSTTATSSATSSSTSTPPTPPPSSGLGTQKILAIGSLVVGVAGVGLGTFFGVQATSRSLRFVEPLPGECLRPDRALGREQRQVGGHAVDDLPAHRGGGRGGCSGALVHGAQGGRAATNGAAESSR